MGRKTLSILFIAMLLVSLLLGCNGGEGTPTAIRLVPQKANMIVYVDLGHIMEDEDIAQLYEGIPKEPGDPQTLEEALNLAMGESGIDLADFREALTFSDTSATDPYGDAEYSGVIVKGTFKKNELLAAIESESGEPFIITNYQGYRIYTDPSEETGMALLGSDAFVLGTMEAVKDVIEVRKGAQPAISVKLLDTYNDLADGVVKVAMLVPPGAIEEGLQGFTGELPPELPMELPLDALTDMDTVGIALAKNVQSISLDGRMCFTSSESAEAAENLIGQVTTMIGRIEVPEEAPGGIPIPIPEEGQELLLQLLDKLEVDTTDSCLTVSLELTLAEIEDLLVGYSRGRTQ